MSSALLNNFSLFLANTMKTAGGSGEMSDEATQVLFGALDGLQDETSQVCFVCAAVTILQGVLFGHAIGLPT